MPGTSTTPGPLTLHVLLTTWQSNLGWDVFVVVFLGSYLYAFRVVKRRREPPVDGSNVEWYRPLLLVLAMLVLVFSVNSALNTYASVLFWVHMVQHLMLIMVVPAFIVTASPLTLLVMFTRGAARQRVQRVLRSVPVSVVTHPIVGFLIFGSVVVETHLTAFVNDLVLDPWLRQVEFVMYLVAGYLFLVTVLGNEPLRWRLPYLTRMLLLFLGMAPDTIVGIVLLQADHELFPAYAALHRTWGPAPLPDLNRGGGIMWAFGDGLMMAFIVGVVLSYIAHFGNNATAGKWLESIRRNQLKDRIGASGEISDLGDDDIDTDEAALAAYNRMLSRLDEGRLDAGRRDRT